MLKINDDIDLKELEKNDFIYNLEDECYEYVTETEKTYKYLLILERNREIQGIDLDLLYDLIQKGLVEKVDDK